MKADGPFPEPQRREYTALVQLPDRGPGSRAVIHHRADAPHHRPRCTVTIVTTARPGGDGTPTGFQSYTIPAARKQGPEYRLANALAAAYPAPPPPAPNL